VVGERLLGERGRERLRVLSCEGGVVDYCNSRFFSCVGNSICGMQR
jgi:hypothetical protein